MIKQRVLMNLSLLDVRIVFLFIAFVHLVVTAVVTLSIDTTVDEDPKVRAYYYTRWKLITCWFNMVMLAYLPARLYVDWKTRRGEGGPEVARLQHATDAVMTGILFPVVTYGDASFWLLYKLDASVIAPLRVFEYLPGWAQHSLHSVSFVVVVLDLLLTPRRRPTNLKPRIALLMAFAFTYYFMILISYFRGEMVYQFFEVMNVFQISLVFVISLVVFLTFFTLQWAAIDFVWRFNTDLKKTT